MKIINDWNIHFHRTGCLFNLGLMKNYVPVAGCSLPEFATAAVSVSGCNYIPLG